MSEIVGFPCPPPTDDDYFLLMCGYQIQMISR